MPFGQILLARSKVFVVILFCGLFMIIGFPIMKVPLCPLTRKLLLKLLVNQVVCVFHGKELSLD